MAAGRDIVGATGDPDGYRQLVDDVMRLVARVLNNDRASDVELAAGFRSVAIRVPTFLASGDLAKPAWWAAEMAKRQPVAPARATAAPPAKALTAKAGHTKKTAPASSKRRKTNA